MASCEEVSEGNFGFLKTDVANWYDSHDASISMFKVLFRDKIENEILSDINDTMTLLNILARSGDLSTTDLTLLYNTIKITNHFGLIGQISKYIKSLPDVTEIPISEFSEQRQKLMKFGNVLTKNGVKLIDGLFNIPLKKYKNSWSMITDLEEREIISEGDAMDKFIESLGKLKLPLAVNALTEEAIQHPRPNKMKSKEISEEDFSFLKTDVSKWYDSHDSSISMFKVLFRDKIENEILSDINDTMALLNELARSDNLSTTDLTLLYNTIKITNHFGLIRQISKYIKSLPDVKEIPISEFSEQSQKLMKFGNVLTKNGVRLIDGLFNTPLKKYKNSWSMITDLEEREIISEGDAMDKFIESLGKLKLPLAVNALTEGAKQHPRPTKTKSEAKISHSSSKRQNTTESRDEPEAKSRRFKSETIHGIVDTTIDTPHASTSTDSLDKAKNTPQEKPYIMPNVTQSEYVRLQNIVSKWWKSYGDINMLKVLLRQFMSKIGQAALQNTNDVMGLFKLLKGMGQVNSSNLTIIFEAVKICGLDGVETEIKKIKPPMFESLTLKNVKILNFSCYRQKLIKFGKKLSKSSIVTIGHLHDIDKREHKGDPWLLLCALEEENIIKQNEATEFVESLRENDMNDEADILDSTK